SFGLHHAGEARGCDAEGKGGRPAENGGGGVHVGDVAQDGGVELDVLEGLPRPVEGEFSLGGAVGVVERGLRGAQLGDPTQVLDRVGGSKTAPACVQVWLLELQQWSEIAHFRDSTLDHRYYSSALTGFRRPEIEPFHSLAYRAGSLHLTTVSRTRGVAERQWSLRSFAAHSPYPFDATTSWTPSPARAIANATREAGHSQPGRP